MAKIIIDLETINNQVGNTIDLVSELFREADVVELQGVEYTSEDELRQAIDTINNAIYS